MTTITTGTAGETLFDGKTVAELIYWAEDQAAHLKKVNLGIFADNIEPLAAALRHMSAQPDPMTVTGRMRWEDDELLYIGRLYVGRIVTLLSKPLQYSVQSHVLGTRSLGYFHDAPAARDALVQAVKEAIEG